MPAVLLVWSPGSLWRINRWSGAWGCVLLVGLQTSVWSKFLNSPFCKKHPYISFVICKADLGEGKGREVPCEAAVEVTFSLKSHKWFLKTFTCQAVVLDGTHTPSITTAHYCPFSAKYYGPENFPPHTATKEHNKESEGFSSETICSRKCISDSFHS